MGDYVGVGEFGTLLANAINQDPRSISTISRNVWIDQKSIRDHIKKIHRPNLASLQIYSSYLDIPVRILREMVARDWGIDCPTDGFAKDLLDILYRHNYTIKALSEEIGVSAKTIRSWFNGKKLSNRNYIKLMSHISKLEGLSESSTDRLGDKVYFTRRRSNHES